MSRGPVKPKKHLGQHFLTNKAVSARIAEAVKLHGHDGRVLEIGPGTGALTEFLLAREDLTVAVIEVDTESIHYLRQHFGELDDRIIEGDFLKLDLTELSEAPLAVVGNFPYNISSQILFRVLAYRNHVPEVVGMFQREVAQRVASPPGSKAYGILSVLLQAFYDIEYLFTVHENDFNPPPKVKSGVIRLTRNTTAALPCDEELFTRVVKTAFNQRRKTLRNSLRALWTEKKLQTDDPIWGRRPEQLSVEEFVALTQLLA